MRITILLFLYVSACVPRTSRVTLNPDVEVAVAAIKTIQSEYQGRLRSVDFPIRPDLAPQIERALRIERVVPSGSIESSLAEIRFTYNIDGLYLTILGTDAQPDRGIVEVRVAHQIRNQALRTDQRVVRLTRKGGKWKGRIDPPLPAPLPLSLLLEHNLPQNMSLTSKDSIVVELKLWNTSRSPVALSYGTPPRLRVRRIRRVPAVIPQRPSPIVFDRANAWGSVEYLESPSPNAVYTLGLTERALAPGASIDFKWRADPLPAGEYWLTVCLELLVDPRRNEGGWQRVDWCAARQPQLTIREP